MLQGHFDISLLGSLAPYGKVLSFQGEAEEEWYEVKVLHQG